jgi:glyoxylase-like metal-dependent hydrolase (beta-lactamase superfamily II)
MKVVHLSCATLCPLGGRWINGSAAVCQRARLVCHVLLVESSDGLVLVDTGLGLDDVRGRSAGRELQLRQLGAQPREADTAVRQVAALGYSPDEVRHVVLTHLDLDHAGGLPDFPRAQVHVMAREHEAARLRRTFLERRRYWPEHWAHQPRWVLHHPDAGERWFGFECARRIQGLPPELLLIPLPGHTRGHAGVAVETPEGWLLHAGDAYFHYGQVNPSEPWCTPGLLAFQRLVAVDDRARRQNLERLRELVRDHREQVSVFSAHDPAELERFLRR